MDTNENFNITTSVYNPQLRTLMSIENFATGLENYKDKVRESTQRLVQVYENGTVILETEGNKDYQRDWSEYLNEVRVHSNQLNQYLELAKERSEQNQDYAFKTLWKDFEDRLKLLKESAQNFENTGAKALSAEKKEKWGNEFEVFESDVEPEIVRYGKGMKLILQFMVRYTPEELEKISQIIQETVPKGATPKEEKDYEAAFLRYLRQYQKEFEKKDNLFDTIMEILSGGVHPSPSERVMLQKWTNGEEKIREDM